MPEKAKHTCAWSERDRIETAILFALSCWNYRQISTAQKDNSGEPGPKGAPKISGLKRIVCSAY